MARLKMPKIPQMYKDYTSKMAEVDKMSPAGYMRRTPVGAIGKLLGQMRQGGVAGSTALSPERFAQMAGGVTGEMYKNLPTPMQMQQIKESESRIGMSGLKFALGEKQFRQNLAMQQQAQEGSSMGGILEIAKVAAPIIGGALGGPLGAAAGSLFAGAASSAVGGGGSPVLPSTSGGLGGAAFNAPW